jgi:hypothetical protein
MLSSGAWSIRCSIQVQLMRIERLASSDRERPIVDHLHCGRPICWARWRVAICDASTGLLKVLETELLRCDVGALGWLLVLRRAIRAMNGVGKTVPFGVAQGRVKCRKAKLDRVTGYRRRLSSPSAAR